MTLHGKGNLKSCYKCIVMERKCLNMAQTNVNIRMDEELKRDFDSTCNDLGLTMTTAFTVFAKAVVRRQRIPFIISGNIPNNEEIEAIGEAEAMSKSTVAVQGLH